MNELFNHRKLVFVSGPFWVGFMFIYSWFGLTASLIALVTLPLLVTNYWKQLGLDGGIVEKVLFVVGFLVAGILCLLTLDYFEFPSSEDEEYYFYAGFFTGFGITHAGIFFYTHFIAEQTD